MRKKIARRICEAKGSIISEGVEGNNSCADHFQYMFSGSSIKPVPHKYQ